MTNNILEEIIYCGISTDESILHFGAGYSKGDFLSTLMDVYEQNIEDWKSNNLYRGIDVNKSKIKMLSKRYKPTDENMFVGISLQEYLDVPFEKNYDWIVLTGVFDNKTYEQRQHDFVFQVVSESYEKSNTGVIFTLNRQPDETFEYSMISFFIGIMNSYNKFIVKRIDDNNYIFCIFK